MEKYHVQNEHKNKNKQNSYLENPRNLEQQQKHHVITSVMFHYPNM